MSSVENIFPNLLDIENIKPLEIYYEKKFDTLGANHIYSKPCPANSVWCLYQITIGFSEGEVNYPILDIIDETENRRILLARLKELTNYKTISFYGMWWVFPGNKLHVRYNVKKTTSMCYLAGLGIALT